MNTTPVRYIGHRPVYREGAYGSGIVFRQGETQRLPAGLATRLLRHADVYVAGADEGATDAVEDRTQARSDDAHLQELRDTIVLMDKAVLETYARTHFKIDLDKRKGVGALRQQVLHLIDLYGVA